MSDKFTIKFKGILDHAATKKAIEQDITKMEKYLKPKKSSLGSTKDIVKNNLSDKKKELSKQSKFESLRERVEKYSLTQTKKLIKQGMGFEKARKEAFKINSAFYTPKERDMLINGTEKEKGVFSGLKGFERELEKEEFLNQASVFKGTLRDLGKLNSYNLEKAVKLAAMLKSSGAKSGEDAVKAVNSFLSGEGDELFDLLKNTWRFGDKYIEDAKKAWQSGAEVDLESRITKMVEMSNDYESLGLTKKADTKEKIDSNLASAEQTLSNLTTSVLDPLIKFINMVTKYFNGFTFQTHVIEPFFKGLKSLFAKLPYIGWVFEDNPTPPKNKTKNNDTGGPPPPSPTPFGGSPEDNNNNTP